MKRKRILLIDADVIAYEACAGCEQEIEFEPGYFTYHSKFEDCLTAFDDTLAHWVKMLKGDEYRLCLTDSEGNFRFSVLPSYKGKRSRKPLALKYLKEYLVKERGAFWRPGLEGDDCLGILATKKWAGNPELVIVSPDKDLQQIPGLMARWPNTTITRHTSEDADYFHLTQTLTGDVTDGYGGCPGIGPVKAEKVLSKALAEFGSVGGRHDPDEAMLRSFMWTAVVDTYKAAGLTEEDALVQARVARILRAEDYDFDKKEPILWTPK